MPRIAGTNGIHPRRIAAAKVARNALSSAFTARFLLAEKQGCARD